MSLETHGISFSYVPARPLFSEFNLVVNAGERVALEAPSGAGKTTLCRLLAGYLEPQDGSIAVDGVSLGSLSRRRRLGNRFARRLAPLPVQLIWQHPEQAVDPLMRMGATLVEGLPSQQGLDEARASGLLERFGIREEWLSRLPHELSGGELMRFCIVRALLSRPRYLICDEMTAMLDAITQARVWQEVIGVAEEQAMGLVVVSHSPELLNRVATRRVRL